MKKHSLKILIIMLLAACMSLIGCGSETEYLDRNSAVRVVFKLEGGVYQNSEADIVYYYGFKKDTENLIKDPAAEVESDRVNPKATVTRSEYTLDGWYREKIQIDKDTVEYKGKWDFKTDKVDGKGVTLYAKWNRRIRYTYGLYYKDESGEEISLGKYDVKEGDVFVDSLDYADQRDGYTVIGFVDADNNAWDPEFKHPGGEESTEIKIYAVYERGEFVEVGTKEQLLANLNSDIRLVADIDLGGEKISFADYTKIFDGNGHKISNFEVDYDVSNFMHDDDLEMRFLVSIGLFGNTENAVVRDVTFENVVFNIDCAYSRIQNIVVAPLAVKSLGSKFDNVKLTGEYVISRIPDDCALVTVTDKGYYYADDKSEYDDDTVEVQITVTDNR